MAKFIARNQRQRFSGMTINLERSRPRELRRIALETLPPALLQFLIARLPQFVADMDAREIKVSVRELQFRVSGFGFRVSDFIDASAFLLFVRPTGIKHHAIAQFERRFELQLHRFVQHARHRAEIHTALLAEPRVDEFLVVDAAEPAGVKPARERHLHRIAVILLLLVGDDVRSL